ncbi:MAG: M28 family peptidase [Flavobacteriaceae bacterium]
MKKYSRQITFLLAILAIFWCFEASMPSYTPDDSVADSEFSTDRALEHIQVISKNPHGVGFAGHESVREYIVGELEKMGLQTSLQSGYTAGDWGNLSKAVNILARIEGSGNGKALLLLSHYDSSPHSSHGASDAGSGIATILESIRAFLSENQTPTNDIIILFTDAEELGLNGADLFVNNHPWAKEVGLALNFEARGSGGPANMLIETNRGNGKLIEEFVKANPEFPVANSLAYSVYKILPNDSDLTVFREDGDIEGFMFAFIDDHFDYHTANDNFERLDRRSLAHQGSYLMPLLLHFSEADLNDLKSEDDYVYYSMPFYKLVSYPFDWIWPMFIIAVLIFCGLLIFGFKQNSLSIKGILKGFIPALLALVINGVIGYFGWTVILKIYPHYADVLQGFTSNGNSYIAAFVLLALTVCFFAYSKFNEIKVADLMVAPIVISLLICAAAGVYLPGVSFYIVPTLALLASFLVLIHQKEPSLYLLLFLSLPALWIFGPLIHMLPVGLGLKMMIASTVLTTLVFLLIMGVVGFAKRKQRVAFLGIVLSVGFFFSGQLTSGYDTENPKPTSLLYVLDANKNTAQWATYEKVPSDWTSQYVSKDEGVVAKKGKEALSSKYSTGFSFTAEAPIKPISIFEIETSLDTVINDTRVLEICIKPQRTINRLEVFTNDIDLESAIVNGIALDSHYLENRRKNRLLTHYVSNEDYTEIKITYPKDAVLDLMIFEASNDLLEHTQFTIPKRPMNNIPMPFVLNDAVLVQKTIRFE